MVLGKKSNKYKVLLICIGLTVVTAVVYHQVGSFEFVNLDDKIYVVHNENVTGGLTRDSAVWAFTSGYASN